MHDIFRASGSKMKPNHKYYRRYFPKGAVHDIFRVSGSKTEILFTITGGAWWAEYAELKHGKCIWDNCDLDNSEPISYETTCIYTREDER